ncbi:MAG: adenosylcobinamide-phosphate synthase CbiB [Andreesenia angusta]|nr:adenosylcobinamide-phosphate synthase CbiB [Andreesenia angusta]
MFLENIILIFIAILIDFLIGDPQDFPHPIRLIGKLISRLEKIVRNKMKNMRLGGLFILLVSISIVISVISSILYISLRINIYFYYIIKTYIIFSGLAAKSLSDECKKVYMILKNSNIKRARRQLSYLVGRDTKELNREEIIRATVETAAENTVDGVLAPLLFAFIGAIFGYPAEFIYFYKTTNTLDSMIGYNNEKYGDIGFFSAKFDDILNLIPARVGAFIMAFSGAFLNLKVISSFRIIIRDRKNHKSPNCAYPEAAVAGLLGVRLGGTNTYFGKTVYKPEIGDRDRELIEEDIILVCKLIYISEIIFFLFLNSLFLIFIKFKYNF